MRLGLNLKISHRIVLMALSAIVGFVLFFAYQQYLVNQTEKNVLLLQDEYTPVLELLNSAREGVTDIERNLEGAVTTAEEEFIDEAKSEVERVEAVLREIESKGTKLGLSQQLIPLFKSYTDNKFFVATSLLQDDYDFEVLGERSQQANSTLYSLEEEIDKCVEVVHQGSADIVTHLLKTNEDSRVIGLTMGAILVALMMISGYLLKLSILKSVKRVTRSMRDIVEGEGDLTRRVSYEGRDELAELVHWFNEFIAKMHTSISSTQETIATLECVSVKLAETSQSSTSLIQSQESAMKSVSGSIQDLTSSVEAVADNAATASSQASHANDAAQLSTDVVYNTVGSIEELAQHVNDSANMVNEFEALANDAGEILGTISSIADQTNLLALNAAIEAARAGEQGRGFAVVADEVRALASRTQASTSEIQRVLEEIQKGATAVVKAMNSGQGAASVTVDESGKAGQSLREITEKVESILALNRQIAEATDEQRSTYHTMSAYIQNVDEVSVSVRDGAMEIYQVSEEIQKVTKNLTGVLGQYKV
ncbi:methyl-accepting chemotaxis protein [Vibrio sp. JC009]|uniref:methyl-accepting chemotaxis protein n=1 Tax=Vibrio sp. JC009 TaxID=2912314 RepID=UPI0023AE8709|nr:methyl-accepting chemotaxis protein [Vibrio sp. JC009]WED22457.1 methyl-accepting chemotaxis protein [Vibrio sp. JC009]